MKNIDLNMQSLTGGIKDFAMRLGRYAILFFLVLLLGVYGFVLVRIVSLHNVQPSDADVTAEVQASAAPQVDPTVVQQMQTLQDNSVSVKTLFDQARNSPFQE